MMATTPEQEAVVEDALKSGVYRTEQEVIEQALNLFIEYELEQEVGSETVRAAIQEGMAQSLRGESIEIRDSEEFPDDIMERIFRDDLRS